MFHNIWSQYIPVHARGALSSELWFGGHLNPPGEKNEHKHMVLIKYLNLKMIWRNKNVDYMIQKLYLSSIQGQKGPLIMKKTSKKSSLLWYWPAIPQCYTFIAGYFC